MSGCDSCLLLPFPLHSRFDTRAVGMWSANGVPAASTVARHLIWRKQRGSGRRARRFAPGRSTRWRLLLAVARKVAEIRGTRRARARGRSRSGMLIALPALLVVACFAAPAGAATVAFSGPTSIDGAGQRLYGVACPSTTQCTAVGDSGQEVTFNPNSPGSPSSATISPSASEDQPVACPSTTQCTVVSLEPLPGIFAGDLGVDEVTFNPTSPGSPTPTRIDPISPPTTKTGPSPPGSSRRWSRARRQPTARS